MKVLVAHQLYGPFPEFIGVWADLVQPGALAVLRNGLTPTEIAGLSLSDFVTRVRIHRAGRRVWRFNLTQVHRYAAETIACPRSSSHAGTTPSQGSQRAVVRAFW